MSKKKMPAAELRRRFLNARTTFVEASGRLKAQMNEDRMREYAAEMKRRGMKIPPIEVDGKFNGPGSY